MSRSVKCRTLADGYPPRAGLCWSPAMSVGHVQLDRDHLWHPFTQQHRWVEEEPLMIERGEGTDLIDSEGRQYIDGVSSLWCNVHGHRHPRLDAAIVEQLGKIAHTTLLGTASPTTIQLAKRLVDITPAGLNHVFFSDDGATAIEAALKIAFQYWRQRPDPKPEK